MWGSKTPLRPLIILLENVIRKRLFLYGTKTPLLMLSEKGFSDKTFSNKNF